MKNINKDVLLYSGAISAVETGALFLGKLISKKVTIDYTDPIILMIVNVLSEANIVVTQSNMTPIYVAVAYAIGISLMNMKNINVKTVTIKTLIIAALSYLEGYSLNKYFKPTILK